MKFSALAILCTLVMVAADVWRDPSPHKSAIVEANGIHIHYLDWGGNGPSMVLITGLGNTAHVFDTLAPKFTDRFHVVGMTRRGFGQSDRPADGYDLATRVADLTAFLDALHIQKAILVGHSIGGDELTGFSFAHPERVIKLVYLDSAVDRSHMPDTAKAEQALIGAIMAKIPKLPPDASLVDRQIAAMKVRFTGQMWSDAWEAEVRENFIKNPDGTWKPRQIPPTLLMMKGTKEAKLDYSKLSSPSLAFFASNDPFEDIPPEKRTELEPLRAEFESFFKSQVEIAKANPHIRVVVMPNTNHYCWMDKPDTVLSEMNTFLK